MEGLRQWAFSLCCAMVACGLAQILLPHSGLERMFKLCVSVFFLCCLLSPVVLRNPGLRIELQEYSQEDIMERARRLTDVIERQQDHQIKTNLEGIVRENLRQRGIKETGTAIHIITNGQNSGGAAPRVGITLDREYEADYERLRRELTLDLGLEVILDFTE